MGISPKGDTSHLPEGDTSHLPEWTENTYLDQRIVPFRLRPPQLPQARQRLVVLAQKNQQPWRRREEHAADAEEDTGDDLHAKGDAPGGGAGD